MRNIHDPNEYHKYKNTSSGNNSGGNYQGPNGACKIVIIVFILSFIYFLIEGASSDAIETLIAFGIIAYLFVKWTFD